MSDLTKMSETEFAEYGEKILHALPFADNDAGLPQTAEFIREQARRLTAAAERVREVEREKDDLVYLVNGLQARHDSIRHERDAARAEVERLSGLLSRWTGSAKVTMAMPDGEQESCRVLDVSHSECSILVEAPAALSPAPAVGDKETT